MTLAMSIETFQRGEQTGFCRLSDHLGSKITGSSVDKRQIEHCVVNALEVCSGTTEIQLTIEAPYATYANKIRAH